MDTAPGEGSKFTIRLPECQRESTCVEAKAPVREQPPIAARILLVDDDAAVRETHQEVLAMGGHEVVPVASAMEALAHCRRQPFDLVITDLSMPGMSGLELATEVKRLAENLPVVLFSGWAVQELEQQVKDAGIDRIVVKPCLMENLLEAVQETLRGSRKT